MQLFMENADEKQIAKKSSFMFSAETYSSEFWMVCVGRQRREVGALMDSTGGFFKVCGLMCL